MKGTTCLKHLSPHDTNVSFEFTHVSSLRKQPACITIDKSQYSSSCISSAAC